MAPETPSERGGPARYEFGPFVFTPSQRELRRDGVAVHLQPKAFDVLAHLIEARARVVSKDELLERLWPEEVVAESSLTFAIKAIRRALGDDGTSQRFLRTFHGRGYRFIEPVREPAASVNGGALPEAEASCDRTQRVPLRDRIMLQPATSPFVGRDGERRALERELDAVRRGEMRTVFVLGDPGVGKTRLVAEFAESVESADGARAQVLLGRCDEGAPAAFWPWVQVVRSCLEQNGTARTRQMAGAGAKDIARLVPGILENDDRAPAAGFAATGEAEHARLRLFDSLSDLLREASRARPLVVVIDDLHWADASSLLLLRHLMRETAGSALLVIGTYRHLEVPDSGPLADLLGWLHRTRRSTRIRLRGLADEEVATLVRGLSGCELPSETVSVLGKVTDGNPFFVEEYCRDVADRGGFDRDSLPADGLHLPDEVRGLLLRRVARLGAAASEVLATAAVLGREFRCDDLIAAADADAGVVHAAIVAAEASGLVHAAPGETGMLAFVHALVASALQESLGAMRRAQIHRRAGHALEGRRGGDTVQRATELARHFSAAAVLGDVTKAFEWEREAGRLLLDRFAYEDAAIHFDRALRFAEAGACDEPARFDLLLALSRASFQAGEETRARQLVYEAAGVARRLGSTGMLARAAIRGATLFPVTPAERVALLEEALAALRAEPESDPELLSRVLAALASSLYARVGEVDRREALVDEALRLARRIGAPGALLRVIRASHVALWRPGHLARRLALAREHLDVAGPAGDPVELAGARTWYVPALLESGEIAEADRQIDLLDRDSTEARMLIYRANALSFRAMRALTRGALADVEFLARRSYEMQSRYDETTASMTLWSQIYYLRREQGRLAEIEPGIRLFASQVPQISWEWLEMHLLCEDDRRTEAAARLERMVADDFREGLPPDAHIVSSAALVGLVECAWRLRHVRAAALLLPRVERACGQWVVVGLGGVCLGSMAYAAGLALAAASRTGEAIAALEQSEREHEAGDVLLPLLRTRAELGLLLAACRDRATRDRGAAMLTDTRARADALGLVHLCGLIDAGGA